jgi:hypothetical protein
MESALGLISLLAVMAVFPGLSKLLAEVIDRVLPKQK